MHSSNHIIARCYVCSILLLFKYFISFYDHTKHRYYTAEIYQQIKESSFFLKKGLNIKTHQLLHMNKQIHQLQLLHCTLAKIFKEKCTFHLRSDSNSNFISQSFRVSDFNQILSLYTLLSLSLSLSLLCVHRQIRNC